MSSTLVIPSGVELGEDFQDIDAQKSFSYFYDCQFENCAEGDELGGF
ncbi:hypothetical protein ACFZDK_54655 [Streptomyces sp. NPDC007901]